MLNGRRWVRVVVLAVGGAITGTSYSYADYTYTTLDAPWANFLTEAEGISGNTIVGVFGGGGNPQGFSETGGIYTTLDDPLATNGTFAQGISGNTIVGYYSNSGGEYGFVATLDAPEPASLGMLGAGALCLIGGRRRGW